jgi:hypothetical protein
VAIARPLAGAVGGEEAVRPGDTEGGGGSGYRCVGGALAATSLGRAAAGRAGALSRVGLAVAEAQREGGLLRRRPRHAPGHKDCRGEEKSRDATGPRAHQAASSRVAPTSLVRAAAERADAPSEVVCGACAGGGCCSAPHDALPLHGGYAQPGRALRASPLVAHGAAQAQQPRCLHSGVGLRWRALRRH